jgi:hypothetical protein
MIRHRGRVKVLAEGDLDRALTVKAHAFSAAARKKKIEKPPAAPSRSSDVLRPHFVSRQ